MTELVLPEGFRISTIQVGGSGRGDEVFVLALFRWSPVFGRSGLLRRKVQTGMGWVHCDTGDWFASGQQVRRELIQTALLLSRDSATPNPSTKELNPDD